MEEGHGWFIIRAKLPISYLKCPATAILSDCSGINKTPRRDKTTRLLISSFSKKEN